VRPDAYLVAEIWRPEPEWLQGDTFDALMNYPLTEAILGFAAQEHLDTSIELPGEYQGRLYPIDGAGLRERISLLHSLTDPAVTAVQLNLLGSHDTPRLLALCGGDMASVRLAILLQMTLPGAPCIYYGDEIGMDGLMDPDCRRAYPADPSEWEREPCRWTADLIALRHSSRAMRDGELTWLGARGPALAYLRRHGEDAFACVLNAGTEPLSWDVPLPMGVAAAELVELRTERAAAGTATIEGGALRMDLPARHGAVVRLRAG